MAIKPTRTTLPPSRPKRKAADALAAATKKLRACTARPVLDVFVFGGNSGAELGLAETASSASVRRPRLNPHLAKLQVTQVAVGGMHCLALTADQQILSWGVNDHGALGRDTRWDGGLRDMHDDDASEASSEGGSLNPAEATPSPIDAAQLPAGTHIAQLAASDNASFALTTAGAVYGWGTFRNRDGVFGFDKDTPMQPTATPLARLSSITHLAAGEDHVLALDATGRVWAWGTNDAHQLGRVTNTLEKRKLLKPRVLAALPPMRAVAAGAKHSFALDAAGGVWSWGQNNYGQTGHAVALGEDAATVPFPQRVAALDNIGPVRALAAGNAHSLALTARGECVSWGRLDACATGHDPAQLGDDDVVRDERGRARILRTPRVLAALGTVAAIAAGGEHALAVTAEGTLFSWGFGNDYRTGLGHDDDAPTPQRVANSAVQGRRLVWAGAGGQFSVVAAERAEGGA